MPQLPCALLLPKEDYICIKHKVGVNALILISEKQYGLQMMLWGLLLTVSHSWLTFLVTLCLEVDNLTYMILLSTVL